MSTLPGASRVVIEQPSSHPLSVSAFTMQYLKFHVASR
jgi:hypothetical protein